MPQRPEPPKAQLRLANQPTMADIHHVLSRAMEQRSANLEVSWTAPDGASEMVLTVDAEMQGRDPEWRLRVQQGGAAISLWSHISCDVLLVFNLIENSYTQIGRYAAPVGQSQQSAPANIASMTSAAALGSRSNQVITSATQAVPLTAKDGTQLSGDLSVVQMPAVLKSMQQAKMTGRLEVSSSQGGGEIFFVEGTPVHASSETVSGEEALLNMIAWRDGRYFFDARGRAADQQTLGPDLDGMIRIGLQLAEDSEFLKNARLSPQSVLLKKHINLSDSAFEGQVSGSALDLAVQKSFYKMVVDEGTIEELLGRVKMDRSQWVPILANLMRCGLLTLSNDAPAGKPGAKPSLTPKNIDRMAIQSVLMSLRRPDSGFFTYPAFLYFLEQEYFRAYRTGSPISVAIFQMSVDRGMNMRDPLPGAALTEASRRITKVKRHMDLVAHYETFDYAVLLPNTKIEGARVFIERMLRTLMETALAPGIDHKNLSLSFGVAAIPEDCLDIGLLLSAAEIAKNEASRARVQVLMYKDYSAKQS